MNIPNWKTFLLSQRNGILCELNSEKAAGNSFLTTNFVNDTIGSLKQKYP